MADVKRWKLWDNQVWSGPSEVPISREVISRDDHLAAMAEKDRQIAKLTRDRDMYRDGFSESEKNCLAWNRHDTLIRKEKAQLREELAIKDAQIAKLREQRNQYIYEHNPVYDDVIRRHLDDEEIEAIARGGSEGGGT